MKFPNSDICVPITQQKFSQHHVKQLILLRQLYCIFSSHTCIVCFLSSPFSSIG